MRSSYVASYSAGRDIEAKLISEPSTGTKLAITATDQIRPIATTTAIPTIHARICISSTNFAPLCTFHGKRDQRGGRSFDEGQRPSHGPRRGHQYDRGCEHQT